MSNNVNKSDLGYLGEAFQYRLVHAFMEEKDFYKDLAYIINQNMFTNANLRIFVGTMKDYLDKYDAAPSYESMEVMLFEKARSVIERDTYAALIEEIKNQESDGIDLIREKAMKFFTQQNMIKCANEMLKVAGSGNIDEFDRCMEIYKSAINYNTTKDMGVGVYSNLESVLSDDYREVIPTGVKKIDEVLEGGIAKGEVGMIICPTGAGKTSMTTSFAANAALNGFKVLQIVFEDSIRQIQRKHIGFITGIEAKDLSKPEYRDKVIETLNNFEHQDLIEKNLMILRLSTGEVTASELERRIKTIINNGFKPDMVVIDYFECLNHDCFINVDGVNEREGKSMRKIEAMAANLNIAIWCPSQGNRDSIGAEVVTESKTSGSIKKAQIAHINMSIARTLEDKENNVATIAILKNRSGSAGKVFTNCSFNNGTCRISTDTCDNEQLLTNVLKKTDNALLKEVFAKAQKKST